MCLILAPPPPSMEFWPFKDHSIPLPAFSDRSWWSSGMSSHHRCLSLPHTLSTPSTVCGPSPSLTRPLSMVHLLASRSQLEFTFIPFYLIPKPYCYQLCSVLLFFPVLPCLVSHLLSPSAVSMPQANSGFQNHVAISHVSSLPWNIQSWLTRPPPQFPPENEHRDHLCPEFYRN